ncbi:MAG: ChbG/HpnK family deacetylase [Planctomycetota bacterium]
MSAAIIQCDDFGITPSVSNGIVRALGAHAATSTSVMANLVADAELGALRTVASRTGVHLNLTLGRPLTPAASLAPLLDAAGEFSGLRVIFKALLTARLPLAAIRCEWQAQIERVRDAGLTVIALDGHQHVHWFGPLAEVAAELAQEFAVERIRAPRHVIGNRLELRTLARALLARAPPRSSCSTARARRRRCSTSR